MEKWVESDQEKYQQAETHQGKLKMGHKKNKEMSKEKEVLGKNRRGRDTKREAAVMCQNHVTKSSEVVLPSTQLLMPESDILDTSLFFHI